MPLNAATLSSALRSALLGASCGAVNGPELTGMCNAIANTVVAHIIANALVTVPPGVTVATTGTAAAQAGATTAPGLGTVS